MVESGENFDREPSFENPAREYYRRLLEFINDEIERSPELRRELVDFVDYILVLQQTVPPALPYWRREEHMWAVNYEVERIAFPRLPVTLPPPSRSIAVGEHMDITTGYHAADFWPNAKLMTLNLTDGAEVTPETPIGKIDIIRNLPQLNPQANPLAFARELLASSVLSLTELAVFCQSRDPRVGDIRAFAGISHLARSGGRLGFAVFDIEDLSRKREATRVSRHVAEHVAGNNSAWQALKENYKPAKIAFVSREHLVETFGTTATGRRLSR